MNSAPPRLVLLFSGHMLDAPGRKEPRFPPAKVPAADRAIRDELAALGAGPQDLAISGGACGGDLLFVQACLERGMAVQVHLPTHEATFLTESVDHGGPEWRRLFFQVKASPKVRLLVMPDEIGGPAPGESKHAENSQWMLRTAQSWGAERVRFLCLWDRRAGDGPGGTQHTHDLVVRVGGQAVIIDVTKLTEGV